MKILKFLGFSLVILIFVTGVFLFKSSIPTDVVDSLYANRSSQFLVMSTGARIHYRDEGKRSGDTIVLLHGTFASLHTWEPWVKILGDTYRIISLDLPAHGLTGAVPDNDYSHAAFISTVDAVVNELGVDSFVLTGSSMGGGVAWRYSLAHPEKVKALVLVSAAGPYPWRLEQQNQTADPPIIFILLSKPWFRLLAAYVDPYYFAQQGIPSAYNYSKVVTDELIMRYTRMALRQGTREASVKRLESLELFKTESPDLSVLHQPTLILWGMDDPLSSLDIAYRFSSVLPNSSLVTFEGVGHIPMEEIPGKSAKAVRDFLSNI
ncbi:MAG: alpha/beta hydrolase [Pseudomonadales bacterium]|jgi:pimeloyl-ACP methyl ester carboxylesterase